MSPVFMGSEPIKAESGKFKGAVICQDEQDKWLKFINSLAKPQKAKAIVAYQKRPTNNVGEAFKDNQILHYIGIKCSS